MIRLSGRSVSTHAGLHCSVYAHLSVLICILFYFTQPAAAVNPSLSGSIVLHFIHQGDPPNDDWYFNGYSGGVTLAVPAVFDITTVGSGNLTWSDPSNWSTFPLDVGGVSLSHTGSGGYTYEINNGDANLNVLQSSGPTELTVNTNVAFPTVYNGVGFTVFSNTVNTRYNVTLPAGDYLTLDQNATLQNLTVNSGASITGGGGVFLIRDNLTNHGSGNFNGTVEGDFINDAVAAQGNVANAIHLHIEGQLQNTGELYIPQFRLLETLATTSNAGSIFLNGTFYPEAAFSNNGTFEFSDGGFLGAGVFTNNGTFDWSGGYIAGTIVNASNSFTISGPTSRSLSGSLTNAGTVTHSGGNHVHVDNSSGILTNQAGGLYDIIDDSSLYDGFSGGTIDNAGTFRKSGGSGVSFVGPAIHNTGTIGVTSGTMRFVGGGTLDGGAMSFSHGGTIEFNNGVFFVEGSNSASGNGTFAVTSTANVVVANGESASFTNFTGGANLVITGNGHLRADAGGTLTLNLTGASSVELTGNSSTGAGFIGGAGATNNTGNFHWSGGTVEGNLSNSSANFTVTGEYQRIDTGNLSNTGTITHSNNGTLEISALGTLANQAGGLYDITADGDIIAGFQSGTVTNAGTFRKSGGSGTSLVNVPFINSGTIAVDSGTVSFQGTDVLTLDPSGTLSFNLAGRDESTDYGKLNVTHELVLDGTFAITLEPGYEPGSGMTFDLMDWQTISGSFDDFDLPALSGGLTWNTSQLDVTGVISVGLPGDFNGDGTVDTADYVVWRKGLGTTHIQSDYDLWTANFGQPAGGGSDASVGAVPEPGSAMLLLLAAMGLCGCRRLQRIAYHRD